MNSVQLIGRWAKVPELKETNSGKHLINMTLAVDGFSRDENGNTRADFIQIVAWNALARNIATHTGKGSKVAISGRIQTRNYEVDGRTVYVTEVLANRVEFLDTRQQAQQEISDYNAPQHTQTQQETSFFQGNTLNISEDDLPF